MAADEQEKDSENEEEQILYDLFVHAEWPQEVESLNRPDQEFWRQKGPLYKKIWKVTQGMALGMMQAARNSLRLKTSFGCPPKEYASLINNHLPWNLALSRNGKLLAVLKNDHIEIRSSKDSFNSCIAKCQVGNDPFSQWRRLAWSKNATFLACSSSFGDVFVFDPTGTLLFTIKQYNAGINLKAGFSNCLCSLFFMDTRKENEGEDYLVTVTYQGALRKYLISSSGFKEENSFSFAPFYPWGVVSVSFSHKHSVLIVAGFQGDEPTMDREKMSGADAGVTLWRQLSDFPFYKMVENNSDSFKKPTGKEILKKMVGMGWQTRKYPEHGVIVLCLSPNQETLLTLHQNGSLALWTMPSLKLQNAWTASEQPYGDQQSAEFNLGSTTSSPGDNFLRRVVCGIKWWSEKAIICSRGSGAITVSSIKNLENLLGHSPELFEPWPRTTDASNGQFLVLECEKLYHASGEKGQSKEQIVASDFFEKDDETETIMGKFSEVFKQTLFFLTENEKFQPTAKKVKYLRRTYRLVALKSTTPEELYSRKIDLEEYGEALDLAKRFKLNTDLVYQCQWIRKPMTVISIKDYLSKVRARFWVLNECVQRVPDDLDALKHLLQYGLMGTNLNAIHAIEADDELPFVIKDDEENDEEVDNEKEAKESSLLKSIKFASLTAQQRQLCKYRWQILQYLDRLETYEIILGGPFRASERFHSEFFIQFRCCNIIDQATEYARTSSSEPLEELFTYHGKHVLPHWLAILSNFPETTCISSYKRVLPGLSPDSSEMISWKELSHRKPDWVEDPLVMSYVIDDVEEEDPANFLYEEQPSLREFRSRNDGKCLTKWYIQRAHEIEERSNLIDNSLALVEFGIQKGVKGLNELCNNLKWLAVLVYEVGIDPAISLVDFERLSDIAKLKLLLSKSTDESFIADYIRWGKPYLEFIGKSSAGKQWKLLHKYITDTAKADLSFPLKIFEKSIPGASIPLIPDVAQLMKMAIESIYMCKRDDQLSLAFGIVECLPTKEDDHLSEQIEGLHKRVDELEELLRGAEILEHYNMPKTISFLVDSKGDYTVAKDLLESLTRNASKRQPPLKPEEWNTLLKHISQLRNDVYHVISISELYKVFAKSLLHSGIEDNLNLAKELLTCTSGKKKVIDHNDKTEKRSKKTIPRLTNALFIIPYDDSVGLVLHAAKEYFNAAANLMDSSMDLARKCLDLIEDRPPLLQAELDLIGALAILDDFNVKILPVQVRLYEDKAELVRLAVQPSPGAYKKTAKVHRLAKLLQVSGSDEKERDGRVATVLAETALLSEDYSFARDMCYNLIDLRYAPSWSTCKSLCEIDKFPDLQARRKLAAFALTFCHPDEIEPLLATRNLIETQIVYNELSQQLDSHAHSETETDDKEDADSTDGQMQSSLFGKTQQNIKSKTKSIISSVSDTKWWKSKVDWVSHAHKTSNAKNIEDDRTKDKLNFICHPFYASLYKDVAVYPSWQKEFGQVAFCEETGSRLDINKLLLRSQKLSESRAEGMISEPSSEVLIQLAEEELYHETLLCLAFILSMPKVEDAEEFFDKCCGDPLVMQMAAYVLSMEILGLKSSDLTNGMSGLYLTEPYALIKHVLGLIESSNEEKLIKHSNALHKYLSKLSDFIQAKTLEDLGKGVDVSRFMQDLEYKRETILGLAMNFEENLLSTALSLAEKYEIETWEVLCANIEFLFSDSGLKAKEIQERLTKLDAVSTLQKHGTEFLSRMKLYVYPYIGGKDHGMLLLLFNYLQQCCGDDAKIEDSLDVASHIRLLKKIKAAAPGMDYKALVHGDDPIEALKPVLMESNVHLLAKLVTKILFKESQTAISSSQIFLLYIQKAFWQEDKKQEDSETKWLHKFEACQKLFSKLNLKDTITFIDEITFSERAVDTISPEIRLNVISRALKHIRQQKVQESKKGNQSRDREGDASELSIDEAETHLEQSRLHIQSFQEDLFIAWSQSDDEREQSYARRYDLSRSNPVEINTLARELFLDLRQPEEVKQFFVMAEKTGKETFNIRDVFHDALATVIQKVKESTEHEDLDSLDQIICLVKEHVENGGNMISQDDVLEVVRPFCADLDVETSVKMELLQLIEKSFELSGDDIFLLVFYQTDAIVSSSWGIKITPEEIDSDDKRHCLFLSLIRDSNQVEQLRSIGKLLLTWPVLASVELSENKPEENPWIILFKKLIEFKDFNNLLEFIRQVSSKVSFGFECFFCVYKILFENGFHLVALKMALVSGNEKCINQAFCDMESVQFDETIDDKELFKLILQREVVHRLPKTPIYPSFVKYILEQSHNEALFANVISQLRTASLIAEAGTLLAKKTNLHPSFSTVDNAISKLKHWFQR